MTPQLMMVSGLGPKADLEALGIPVVADIPVGTTHQNHNMATAMYCKSPDKLVTDGTSTDVFPVIEGFTGIETDYPKTTAPIFAMGTSPYAEDPAVADYALGFITNAYGGPVNGFFDCSLAGEGNGALTVVVTGIMQ